jgi:ABC-2 type transport system permease protein
VAWHFYLVTPLLIGLFIVLPGSLGAWAALIIARYLDRRSFQLLALGGAVLVLVGAVYWLRAETITDDMLETRVLVVLDRLLVKTRFAQFAMLPSYWLSAGVLQWSEGALAGATFFALLLLSYALFFGYLTVTQTGGWFYGAFSAVQSRGSAFWKWGWFNAWESSRRISRYRVSWLERGLRLLPLLPIDVRALVAKDIRVFWRDTAQWGQTLVLFGLLAVYVINLRHFSQQLSHPFWVHVVSYLNLGACSLNLATLTTRFVFPQFSLEGKRLWIVGMAPMGLVQVLKVKYGLATAASLAVTLSLIILSCQMLQMPAVRTAFFAVAVGIMTFTLNGLAIGLGALYPNLKEDNPSKIVSGFGGTLCLVLSFLYIVVSVVLLAFGSPWPWAARGGPSLTGVLSCGAAFLVCSWAVGWLPYRWGVHQVRRFES